MSLFHASYVTNAKNEDTEAGSIWFFDTTLQVVDDI